MQASDEPQASLLHSSETRGSFGFLTHSCWWSVGIIWILAVIISGGAYILTLAGVCGTWSTSTCERFEEWQIQFLTILFTAINLYVLPTRLARLEDVCGWGCVRACLTDEPCVKRSLMAESYDPASFDSLSWSTRCSITLLLIISTLAQYVNQIFHVLYWTYDAAMHYPGDLWDNLFFLISLATMLAGIVVEGCADRSLRADHPPGNFKPTAAHVVAGWFMEVCCGARRNSS